MAGRLVRLACERHLRDLDDGAARGLAWSLPHALHAINFFRFCRHPKGPLGGQRIELAPWQKFCIGSVFGWLRADGTRRFRTSFRVVAKKNGKSTECAGVGLYCMLGDGEFGAEVYSTATSKDQAKLVFEPAKFMARSSPELLSRLDVFKNNISDQVTQSKFMPLHSDAESVDGINPHCAIHDELHRHKTRALLDLLNDSGGARLQPLSFIITTAGDDRPGTPYAQEEDYAIKVLEGVIQDDSYFAYLAMLDKGDRWDDESVWAKANPNLGVSVSREDLRERVGRVRANPEQLRSFQRLRLNIRTAAETRAIDMALWAENTRGPIDEAALMGREFYGALDLSSKYDLSCWLRLYPPLAKGEPYIVAPRFYLPEEGLEDREDRDRAPYRRWVKAGLITVTPGNLIDHDKIEEDVKADCAAKHPREIPYDPWNAAQLTTHLSAAGLPMVEFTQSIKLYAAPCKELTALLMGRLIEHGGNPVLTWMASNLHWYKDPKDNLMPSKKSSTGRIDGMSCLIMALGRAIVNVPESQSFWETRAA